MVALVANHALEPYYRRELVSRWRHASTEQRRRGREWYPAARRIMESLARDTGYTLEQAIAVMAITSAAAQLLQNLRYTRRALESHGRARVGRFPNQMTPKVRAILRNPAMAREYVTGPKVSAFHRAIMGENALVLDRWAIYAGAPLESREANHNLTASARAALERAYRNAARAARMRVRDFQAAIWLQTRESTPLLRRGEYVTVRFSDITAA